MDYSTHFSSRNQLHAQAPINTMLDNGSEPCFPVPLANIFRNTLMNSVIKLVNRVPFCLQYQMLYGVGGGTLPVKKTCDFRPVGELCSAPDLFSAASSSTENLRKKWAAGFACCVRRSSQCPCFGESEADWLAEHRAGSTWGKLRTGPSSLPSPIT